MERLRYSDRKRLADQGSLGPLEYTDVPAPLRKAIASIYRHAAYQPMAGEHFDRRMVAACEQHFGRTFYGRGISENFERVQYFIEGTYRAASVDEFLDVCEILAEEAVRVWGFNVQGQTQTRAVDP